MKTTFNYDHYYDWEEMTNCIKKLVELYPDLITMTSLAKSEENKDVWAVTITNTKTGSPESKPAYYIDGNIHAGEVTGSMCAIWTIDTLCSNTEDATIQKLLDAYTFYIIPKVTPDGSDAYLHSYEKLRSVNRAYPYLEKEAGLHPQDIDGDGVIRMMRVKSPYGSWKVFKDDKRVMVRRLPNDVEGEYYHVYPEGEIVDYDGRNVFLAKNKWGLDFNRNFPFGWFSEIRQPGAGKYPLSNVETKALADFILSHPNIGFVSALHTTGGVVAYPPGTYPEKKAHASDMKLFHDLGILSKEITGYEAKNIFDEFLTDTDNYSSGAFDDWCYETQGIPAVTIELWDLLMRAGVPYKDIYYTEKKTNLERANDYKLALEWIDKNNPDNGFKTWTAIIHPQLGEVEVGGFDFKFNFQNPPASFLEQEVNKVGTFLLESAKALPQLVIEEVKVTKLNDQLHKLVVTIANHGYMDTNLCKKAEELKVAKPIKATVDGGVVIEKISDKVDSLAGYGSIHSDYGYDAIDTILKKTQTHSFSWIIATEEKEVLLKIESEKAGSISQKITINS